MPKDKTSNELASEHVDWFLKILRPLLIEHFIHGYKHGREHRDEGDLVIDVLDDIEKEYEALR